MNAQASYLYLISTNTKELQIQNLLYMLSLQPNRVDLHALIGQNELFLDLSPCPPITKLQPMCVQICYILSENIPFHPILQRNAILARLNSTSGNLQAASINYPLTKKAQTQIFEHTKRNLSISKSDTSTFKRSWPNTIPTTLAIFWNRYQNGVREYVYSAFKRKKTSTLSPLSSSLKFGFTFIFPVAHLPSLVCFSIKEAMSMPMHIIQNLMKGAMN